MALSRASTWRLSSPTIRGGHNSPAEGIVTLPSASAQHRPLKDFQDAATAVRHVSIATTQTFGVGGHSDYRGDRDDASALAHLQIGRIQPQIGQSPSSGRSRKAFTRSSMSLHSFETWLFEMPESPIACAISSTRRVDTPPIQASWIGDQRLFRCLACEDAGLLARLAGDFSALYSRMGRPSIPPEKLLRAMLLQAF
jgi:hypothetical protein